MRGVQCKLCGNEFGRSELEILIGNENAGLLCADCREIEVKKFRTVLQAYFNTMNNAYGQVLSFTEDDCLECDGRGVEVVECDECYGTGVEEHTCGNCNGTGAFAGGDGEDKCGECNGEGLTEEMCKFCGGETIIEQGCVKCDETGVLNWELISDIATNDALSAGCTNEQETARRVIISKGGYYKRRNQIN